MSRFFKYISTFGEEVLVYGCIDSDNQLDYITQAKSILFGDAPVRVGRHIHKTFFHLCKHVLRQTVSGNMGYEVCQEVPLQSVNKGVLEPRELLKREESSHPSTAYILGRLTFDLSVTEEAPLNSICCNSIPTSLYSLSPHKNPKLSKSISFKTQPVHIYSLLRRQRYIMLCTYTYFLFSRKPYILSAHVLNYSCILELKSPSCIFGRTREQH